LNSSVYRFVYLFPTWCYFLWNLRSQSPGVQDQGEASHHTLPRHEDDYSWDACSDLLFQDHDVLMLFDASLAGIEAPGNPANQRLGAGDLRVDSWFEPFDNGVVRNPQRGFRR
jgi:hypothetical protein